MDDVKTIYLVNNSQQRLALKTSWTDGGTSQQVQDGNVTLVDLNGVKEKNVVTIETMVGNRPLSTQFRYTSTGRAARVTIFVDGSFQVGWQ